jgi:hypothetical protein
MRTGLGVSLWLRATLVATVLGPIMNAAVLGALYHWRECAAFASVCPSSGRMFFGALADRLPRVRVLQVISCKEQHII